MHKYIIRRLILGALTAGLVSVLIFAILRIAPGDVALMLAEAQGGEYYTQAMVDTIRENMGLNDSLPVQYFSWAGAMLTGDWGRSMYTDLGVFDTFRAKVVVTLELVLMSLTVSTSLGIPLGIIMALKQDTWVDYVVRVLSLAGLSMPSFWTATLFVTAGLYLFDWTPRLEYVSFLDDPLANLNQFIWPAVILGWVSSATKARMMRSTMLEVLRQDYIRTARAKGLRNFVVTYRHALKNAMLPVITIIGVTIAFTMGGSVIIERVFAMPGIGNFLVEGMNYRDYPVVQSLVLFFAMWVVLVNLLVDLTYGWLDPRIRYD